jgi:mono/diheme cytochrome c family protein
VPPQNGFDPAVGAGEVFVWVLFFALLVPAGLVGWAIGSSGHETVTVTVSGARSSPVTATTSAATTSATKPAAPASAPQGKAVFSASGCSACHTFKPAGASGTIGPDLDTKPAIDAKKANKSLAAFVRESIVKPNAYISPGYPKNLMPQNFATRLSKSELAALVAFLTSGK